ncbi:hypothetical protein MNBD_GAMMA11-450 [hydrothermal vent metagenome]|uniref:Uncharacterized protein n=1 Tax=hydrothermal vent metagenome TaxID=652676 RepID=A0A3B0XWB7_9ZZZZ
MNAYISYQSISIAPDKIIEKNLILTVLSARSRYNTSPEATTRWFYIMDNSLTKELDVLVTLRKVISSMVRDITPEPGMRHPLSDETLEDVRQGFMLIAAREKEISEAVGKPSLHRPQYKGGTPRTKVVKLHGLKSVKKDNE